MPHPFGSQLAYYPDKVPHVWAIEGANPAPATP